MTGKTHAIVGANAAWITFLSNTPIGLSAIGTEFLNGIDAAVFYLAIGALGGLMPDIDAPHSKFHTLTKGVFRIIGITTQHRGFFHSILAILMLLIITTLLFGAVDPWIGIVLTLGYSSHSCIDMLTPGGVRILFPLKRKQRWLPRKIAPNTGGIIDNLLFLVGSGTIILYIFYTQGYELILT